MAAPLVLSLRKSSLTFYKITSHYQRFSCPSFSAHKKLIPLILKRHCFSAQNELDIENLFLKEEIQRLLKKLTKVNLEKIYRPVKKKITSPQYQFYSDEEFEQIFNEAKLQAEEKLQMPPVLNPRKPIEEIISKDPEIQGMDENNCKYLIIDIGRGYNDRNRLIAAREPNGVLRTATWEERDLMNQIYFPKEARQLIMPAMFETEQLEVVLSKEFYEFVLNRACIQFDPDDPEFIRVTTATYEHINKKYKFELLQSTRHYGPMVFYLVVNKIVDNLLLDMIERELLDDGVDLIKLYHIIHPNCKSLEDSSSFEDSIDFIMNFIKKDAVKTSHLELALQTLKELRLANKALQEGVNEAHGL